MVEIKGTVTGLKISLTEKPPVTTGNRKSVRTVFEFEGDLWDVCEKRVVFWNAKNPKDKIPMPLDVNNSCDVPAYVLTNVGDFYFGIIGLAEDGEVKKVSTIIKYPLTEGTPDGTTDVEEMPPDLWEQQLAIMGEALGAAHEAITTADEALGIANYAAETANNAVDKLDICYVDEEGILHIYACENIKQIAPTIDVATNDGKVYVLVTNVDGTNKAVMIPSGEDGKDGTSATIQVEEIEGGHRLTIRDISGVHSVDVMDGKDGLDAGEKLIGSTSDIQPVDVVNAMANGKTVIINHSDSTYGVVFFSNFAFAVGMNIVASSVTFERNGIIYNASLTGDGTNNTWTFSAVPLATDKTATAVDLSGYDNGVIVETYADGSTLTHNLTFDSDGKVTKITDSNGNETVLTW